MRRYHLFSAIIDSGAIPTPGAVIDPPVPIKHRAAMGRGIRQGVPIGGAIKQIFGRV